MTEQSTQPMNNSWEEEFTKLETYTNEYGYVHDIPNCKEIKSFISQLLASERASLLKEIEEKMPDKKGTLAYTIDIESAFANGKCEGWNECINYYKSLLNSLK